MCVHTRPQLFSPSSDFFLLLLLVRRRAYTSVIYTNNHIKMHEKLRMHDTYNTFEYSLTSIRKYAYTQFI